MSSTTTIKKYGPLYLNGIAPDNFVGEDVRYSNNFEEIETLVSEANSMFGSANVNWQTVLELSENVLKGQSKDLRVLTWFVWALFKTSSFTGLTTGIIVLQELVNVHWDEIHPKRDKTRISSIDWLFTRLEPVFSESFPVKAELPLFKELLEKLTAIDTFFIEKWDDKSPLLTPSCRRLERLIQEAETQEVAAATSTTDASQTSTTTTSHTGTSAAITSSAPSTTIDDKEVVRILRNIQDNSRSLGTWWLQKNSTDIKALRLNRTLLWVAIETAPEHKSQTTQLRGVPQDKVKNYKERISQGRCAELLPELENSISKAPFWLDGQYMAWQCLEFLRADAAMLEVEIQLALFLSRVPSLVELKFHDEIPFASEETVNWINNNVLPRLGKAKAQPQLVGTSSGTAQKWDEILQDCILSLSSNGLKEAIKPLLNGLQTAHGDRARLFWHLCMAKLCFASKQYEIAKTKLEDLDVQMQRLNILQWEPALVLEVVYLLYRCYELLPQSQTVREVKEKLNSRLCLLDINLILDEK